MDKVRIHEIASELGLKSKEVVERAIEIGFNVKAASSTVTYEEAEKLMDYIMSGAFTKSTTKTKEEKKSSVAKKEDKKESVKAVKEKKEEKTKKEEVSKTEAVKKEAEEKISKPKEVEKETLATTSMKKRRGLVIVKKKRPKEEVVEKEPEAPVEAKADLAQMLQTTEESLKKKTKKAKKTPAAPKKESGKKIEILTDRELSDVSIDLEEEVVVLPDFSEELKKVEEKQKKEIDDKRIKVARKSFVAETRSISRGKKKKKKKKIEKKVEEVKVVEIPEDIRVYEFAEKTGKSVAEVIKVLFNLGMMVTKNDFLDKDTLEVLAEEFGVEIKTVNPLEELDYVKVYDEKEDEYLEERPPVITIMGHVDHGKTSLLDKIRHTKVAEKEAGGITQHIGAYMVEKDGKKITFIDTPGHEAFTEMRARGAKATDIAIIVVAADDGVKPQTVEAINHAKSADVPMIIAINKIDKPDANPDLVKSQLAEMGITPVDWGGEYEFVEVSAKTGQGIDELLETILLQAELMELKANPKREAKAVVIESSLEKGRGPVATVIVQNGTLHMGDHVVCGTAYGRVRAIIDDLGKNVKERRPSEPGVVVGLNKVPAAGEIMVAVKDDKTAREYAERRAEYERQKELSKTTKVTLEELSSLVKEGQIKTLPVIIKADTQGSLEAIKGSLEKLRNEEVKIKIIHSGVGGITETDVSLADASENAIILGFNVRPTGAIKEKAKQLGIQIRTYSIIYDLIDDVKALLSGLLSPVIKEEVTGQAEVRETFTVPKIGTVAGCIVTDGIISRNSKARVIRDGVVIYDSRISSLKRFKDDVKEVTKGYECGLMIENFNDIKVGDIIETYKETEEQQTL
ncbi:translation initiation factor IF-2 [Nitrosophilus alvini]|uniref:translation initiation factor IF-2 n=1 Tax=Nitrosophilus alvini TaxID=2714855 RepID=UPI00190D21CF|nr:translation initiation factor IF-2 [Nitrosophilus alvini]